MVFLASQGDAEPHYGGRVSPFRRPSAGRGGGPSACAAASPCSGHASAAPGWMRVAGALHSKRRSTVCYTCSELAGTSWSTTLTESTRIWADPEAQLHLADRCMVPFPTVRPICAPVRPGALPGSSRHHPGTGIPAHLGAAVIYPERPLPSAGIRALMPCSRGRLFQVRTWLSSVNKGDARLPGMRHNLVCELTG